MKTVNIELPTSLSEARIHIFADLHIGDANCDLKHIKERIDNVKKDSNAYIILNGDIINNATKDSVSDIYSETLSPMKALNLAVELFRPIKDRILCVTMGNHENRTYKATGTDLLEIFSKELGVEDRYSPTSVLLYVRLGQSIKVKPSKGHKRQIWYSFYVTHGSGGGRSSGSKVNAAEQLQGIIDVDIYVHSHTHMPAIWATDFFRTCPNNYSVQQVSHLFVNTNAELNYGGYGETAKFKPSCKSAPVLSLCGKYNHIDTILSI